MNGKEQFKQARNSHLSSIMSVYGVDKDLAYQALAAAFENPYVSDAISRAVEEQFCDHDEKDANPYLEWEKSWTHLDWSETE